MGYITTFTGINFYKDTFTEDDFNIEDIAHSLAMTCRWSGHVPEFYSVAQHSVYVSRWMLWNKKLGLIHDGSEGYITDVPTPFKRALPDYTLMEERIQNSIYSKFLGKIPTNDEHEYLKIYDRLALDWEGTMFIKNWKNTVDISIINEVDDNFYPWPPKEAKERFLKEWTSQQ